MEVNLLILLDRSSSMDNPLDGSTRWLIALEAIDRLLDRYGGQLRFGLALYPQEFTACDPGEVLVPVQADAQGLINSALDDSAPGGLTPSGPSLATVGQHPPLFDSNADNAILYITDGQENCSRDPDQVEAAGDLLARGIRTFVVGFTLDVGFDELNATAEAGGTARKNPDDGLKFYLATDADTLDEAFAAIAGGGLACTFDVDGIPSDPDQVLVYVDGELVTRDRSQKNGWDYDEERNQITFYGSACADHLSGDAVEITVVQSCAPVID